MFAPSELSMKPGLLMPAWGHVIFGSAPAAVVAGPDEGGVRWTLDKFAERCTGSSPVGIGRPNMAVTPRAVCWLVALIEGAEASALRCTVADPAPAGAVSPRGGGTAGTSNWVSVALPTAPDAVFGELP